MWVGLLRGLHRQSLISDYEDRVTQARTTYTHAKAFNSSVTRFRSTLYRRLYREITAEEEDAKREAERKRKYEEKLRERYNMDSGELGHLMVEAFREHSKRKGPQAPSSSFLR